MDKFKVCIVIIGYMYLCIYCKVIFIIKLVNAKK